MYVASIRLDFHKEWMEYIQKAIWSRAFGPSIARNMITRGLTISHLKRMQSTLNHNSHNSHHDSKVYKVKGYLSSRVSRYPNSASTFQISCLIISGDIAENLDQARINWSVPRAQEPLPKTTDRSRAASVTSPITSSVETLHQRTSS